jgi:hypothetical protein
LSGKTGLKKEVHAVATTRSDEEVSQDDDERLRVGRLGLHNVRDSNEAL